MKKQIERIKNIAEIIRERNGITIKELAQEIDVSEMTVRRDLNQLHNANIISLVHGAAIYKAEMPINGKSKDYHVFLEKTINNPEKERIGKAAAELVKQGDTIIIDIGTTTEHLARNIPQNSAITVFCYTINVLFEIYKKNVQNLIIGGGYYHSDTQLFEYQDSKNFIQNIRASKFFISAAGVSYELGLTCINQYEVGIKQACIASSQQKILLADSNKFGKIRPAFFSSLNKIDTVITDNNISDEWVKNLENMEIKIIIA